MNDDQLRHDLRRLPRARAGDGFTEAVLARLEESDAAAAERATPAPWLHPALGAAAVALLVAATLLMTGVLRPERGPAADRADGVAVSADVPETPVLAPPASTAPAEPAADAVRQVADAAGPTDPVQRDAARRLAELRRERERLRVRLAALESLPRREPKLLLAGDESVELVLDLGRTRDAEDLRGSGTGTIRPAAYPSGGGGPRYH